jgi:hypothetical protein
MGIAKTMPVIPPRLAPTNITTNISKGWAITDFEKIIG